MILLSAGPPESVGVGPFSIDAPRSQSTTVDNAIDEATISAFCVTFTPQDTSTGPARARPFEGGVRDGCKC